jgi:hypothetical protein
MAKSFRRFREDHYDDEWGNSDDYEHRKRNKLKERKQKQRQKVNEKMNSFDEKDIDK